MTVWQRMFLALVAGALMPLAYAPFDLYPLGLLALAMLFYLWLQVGPRQAFGLGLLFGLAMFGGGVSWVYISIHDYGYVPLGLSVALTLLFIVVLALFPACSAYVVVRCRMWLEHVAPRTEAWLVLLVLPAIWLLFEWVRGWFLTGFPWLHIGYSHTDSPLAGYAPLLGVYGVSLLAAVSSSLLLLALMHRRGGIRGGYLLVLVALWLVGALLSQVEWTRPMGQPVRVSLVQGNIAQEMKWLADMRQPTLNLYADLTREHWESDLVIWPETAIPLFSYQAQTFLEAMKAEAALNDTDMLVGLVYQDQESGAYYNSMLGLGVDGGRYDKHHLVPFTEYLPFKSALAGIIDVLDVPMSDFSAGEVQQQPLQLAGQAIGISICYEDAFGEEVIRSLPQASLLVNVSNDAWFAGSIAPAQHLQMARMRALETGRELMRATNTGISAFISAHGKLRQVAPQFTTEVLTLDVQPRSGSTPYVWSGNRAALVLALLMIVASIFIYRRGS